MIIPSLLIHFPVFVLSLLFHLVLGYSSQSTSLETLYAIVPELYVNTLKTLFHHHLVVSIISN